MGLAAMVVGFLLSASALVAAIGRIAQWLPLSLRIATRDVSRHRYRAAPAITAISLAVAASAATAIAFAGVDNDDRASYRPIIPVGTAIIDTSAIPDGTPIEQRVAAAADVLHGSLIPLLTATPDSDGRVSGIGVSLQRCTCASLGDDGAHNLAVGDLSLLTLVLGRTPNPDEVSDFNAGHAFVLAGANATPATGTATVQVPHASGETTTLSLPAEAIRVPTYDVVGAAIISHAAAAHLGFGARQEGFLVQRTTPPTTAEQERAANLLRPIGGYVNVEGGYHSHLGLIASTLVAASVLLSFGCVAIITGLGLTEGRADLVRLTAVGAKPGQRRRVSMANAATVTLIGTVGGRAFGIFLAAVLVAGLHTTSWVTPWQALGILAIAAPLLSTALAGVQVARPSIYTAD